MDVRPTHVEENPIRSSPRDSTVNLPRRKDIENPRPEPWAFVPLRTSLPSTAKAKTGSSGEFQSLWRERGRREPALGPYRSTFRPALSCIPSTLSGSYVDTA